ncbi:MAG: NAD(+)/NADH kinase [Sphaerochaetaceae bacterium]|nr:NAD(+)/NADH kinase [Sphaerochaetaceae bacterium]
MELKKAVIVANGGKEIAKKVAKDIDKYLRSHNVSSTIVVTDKETDFSCIDSKTNLLVSVGGDGTVLATARAVLEYGIPILAVNLGTFGYITEIGPNEWQEALDDIFEDKETISRRLTLKVIVSRGDKKVFKCFALNDAVVSSAGISRMVHLNLKINNTMAGQFRSDGLIISTPTGSTGYSLAAGGPILFNDMSAILVTSICPFTLSNRPLVVGSNDVVTINVPKGQRTDLLLTVDGQVKFEILEGDEVVVEKSRSRILLVNSRKRNQIEILRSKLNWSGGTFNA